MDPSYNNGFGSQGAMTPPQVQSVPPQAPMPQVPAPMPISSGTGDIVLTPEKKSKKGVMIGLILGVALIAIVAVGVMIKVMNEKQISNSACLAFDRFANYLIYGNEDEDFIKSDFNLNTEYALTRAIINHDEDYLSHSNDLAQYFLNDETWNKQEKENVTTYMKKWAIIYNYGKNILYDDDELIDYYLSYGKDATTEKVELEYKDMTDLNDEDAQEIAEGYLIHQEYLISFLNKASEAGCIVEGNIDELCAEQIVYDENDSSGFTERDESEQKAETLIRIFLQDLWSIREILDEE